MYKTISVYKMSDMKLIFLMKHLHLTQAQRSQWFTNTLHFWKSQPFTGKEGGNINSGKNEDFKQYTKNKLSQKTHMWRFLRKSFFGQRG